MKLVAQPAERMSHMEAESLADSLQPVMFGDMSAWSLPHFPVKLSPVICYNGKKSKRKIYSKKKLDKQVLSTCQQIGSDLKRCLNRTKARKRCMVNIR